MLGPLVVVGPGSVARAERERAGLNLHVAGGADRLRTAAGMGAAGDLDRLEHRLAVLALVLDDQAEDERAVEQRVVRVEVGPFERFQRALTDGGHVLARGLGPQKRKIAAAASLVHERVVELLPLLEQRRKAADALRDP